MKYSLGLIAFVGLCLIGFYFFVKAENKTLDVFTPENESTNLWQKKLEIQARKIELFAAQKGYNTDKCLLIDMHLESGSNRMFLYDLKRDSVLLKGLVTHGRCNERWLEGRKYGNKVGCGCSSLGKYKIGASYIGKFGLAYKLYGLDSSNNNAFERFVVLHSHECVPEEQIFPDPICQSDGCPTVSPKMIQKLSAIIDESDKPMLLYIFDEQ